MIADWFRSFAATKHDVHFVNSGLYMKIKSLGMFSDIVIKLSNYGHFWLCKTEKGSVHDDKLDDVSEVYVVFQPVCVTSFSLHVDCLPVRTKSLLKHGKPKFVLNSSVYKDYGIHESRVGKDHNPWLAVGVKGGLISADQHFTFS